LEATFLERIRVVLLDMLPLLLEIVKDAIAPQDDMEIVANAASGQNLDALLQAIDADVVVVKRDDVRNREQFDGFLYQHPRLRILEIIAKGRRGVVNELRPRRIALGEISTQSLLDTIRGTGCRKTVINA
jgi:chemotaxis response regulator CheB